MYRNSGRSLRKQIIKVPVLILFRMIVRYGISMELSSRKLNGKDLWSGTFITRYSDCISEPSKPATLMPRFSEISSRRATNIHHSGRQNLSHSHRESLTSSTSILKSQQSKNPQYIKTKIPKGKDLWSGRLATCLLKIPVDTKTCSGFQTLALPTDLQKHSHSHRESLRQYSARLVVATRSLAAAMYDQGFLSGMTCGAGNLKGLKNHHFLN